MAFPAVNRSGFNVVATTFSSFPKTIHNLPQSGFSFSNQEQKQKQKHEEKGRESSEIENQNTKQQKSSFNHVTTPRSHRKHSLESPTTTKMTPRTTKRTEQSVKFAGQQSKGRTALTSQPSESRLLDLDGSDDSSTTTSPESITSTITTAATSTQPHIVTGSTLTHSARYPTTASSPNVTNLSTPCPKPTSVQRMTVLFDPNADPATIQARRKHMIQQAMVNGQQRLYSMTLQNNDQTDITGRATMQNTQESKKKKRSRSVVNESETKQNLSQMQFGLKDAVNLQIRLERLKLRRGGHPDYQHVFLELSEAQINQEIKNLSNALSRIWKENDIDGAAVDVGEEDGASEQERTNGKAMKRRKVAQDNASLVVEEFKEKPVKHIPIPEQDMTVFELQALATKTLSGLLPRHILANTNETLRKQYPTLHKDDNSNITRTVSNTKFPYQPDGFTDELVATTNLSTKAAKRFLRKHREAILTAAGLANTSRRGMHGHDSSAEHAAWDNVLAIFAARDLLVQQSKRILSLAVGIGESFGLYSRGDV